MVSTFHQLRESFMLKNNFDSFGSVAKIFHWVMALCVFGMLAVGLVMTDMGSSPEKTKLYGLHEATGVVVLLLAILRLTWRFLNSVPRLPGSLRPWHHRLSRLSPLVLYALLFLMPLSGIILSQAAGYPVVVYDLFSLPNILPKNLALSKVALMVHQYGAFTLMGVLGLHASAALYHHFILKTNVLRRMLPDFPGK